MRRVAAFGSHGAILSISRRNGIITKVGAGRVLLESLDTGAAESINPRGCSNKAQKASSAESRDKAINQLVILRTRALQVYEVTYGLIEHASALIRRATMSD